MKIYIRDHNENLIDHLKAQTFHPKVIVDAKTADIFENPVDAFVSPANSFGYMDGGIDLYYCQQIGWHLQENIQAAIGLSTKFNELLIGEALLIYTGNEKAPRMISAPTMRMPGRTSAANVFLATRAAVALAYEHGVETLALPGMGTGCGGVPYPEAALAMATGIGAATNWYEKNG